MQEAAQKVWWTNSELHASLKPQGMGWRSLRFGRCDGCWLFPPSGQRPPNSSCGRPRKRYNEQISSLLSLAALKPQELGWRGLWIGRSDGCWLFPPSGQRPPSSSWGKPHKRYDEQIVSYLWPHWRHRSWGCGVCGSAGGFTGCWLFPPNRSCGKPRKNYNE